MSVGYADKTEAADLAGVRPLNPVEVGVIHLFVQFSRALGQPRSVAEIYGLLFISHRPLPMDELIRRLELSKGSASQGLRYLLDFGAVRTVYVAGERRTHYEAVAELRNLAGRFLGPHCGRGAETSGRGMPARRRAREDAPQLGEEREADVAAGIEDFGQWRVMPPAGAVMPHTKHNRRAGGWLAARGTAANGLWRKIPPGSHVRQLGAKKSKL